MVKAMNYHAFDHAEQESQARRMMSRCGLQWDDSCIGFHNNKRSVGTAGVTQMRQPATGHREP